MSQHSDPEELALLALGEQVPAAVTEHLATCPECAAELESLAEAAGLIRSARGEELVAPPESVWAGIASELGLASSEDAVDAERAATVSAIVTDEVLEGSSEGFSYPAPTVIEPEDETSSTASASSTGGAEVIDLASRRAARPWPWIAAAAAAGVVVGGVGASWIGSIGPSEPEPAVVAQAPLDALPAWTGASGKAVVHEGADGSRTLVLDVAGEVPEDGFREVWLIDREVTRLVSIGVLEGSQGTFVLPSGIDLSDFAVVDVSQEHFDGDPAHSGDSIVRGILDT